MKTASIFSRLAIISLLLFLFNTSNNLAQPVDSLNIRLNIVINKVDGIRLSFLKIAQMVNNEGVPGWDKVVDKCNDAGQTIDNLRTRINNITDRFNHNTFPIPNGIHIPGYTVHILNRDIHFPGLNANIPNFPPQFPKVTTFISRFFDLVDQPLDKVLIKVNALEDTISNSFAQSRVDWACPDDTSNIENADYFYACWMRNSLGKPWVVLTVKELSAVVDNLSDNFLDAVTGQTIEIAGEGGNLRSFKMVMMGIKLPMDMIKEFIDHIDGDAPSAEINANYRRLGFIHQQIDTLKTDFNQQIGTLKNDFDSYWQTTDIQRRVEENLAWNNEGPHAIATFQLPAQFGGYLEIARNIVQEAINDMQSAGENIYNALQFFQTGEQKFAAHNYKQAYYYYSKAYGEATFVVIN
jgi:hypothetical protein